MRTAKKITLILTMSESILMLFSFTSHTTWYTCCTVNNSWCTKTGVQLRLTADNSTFTNVWFEVAAGKDKEVMATALVQLLEKVRVPFLQIGQ